MKKSDQTGKQVKIIDNQLSYTTYLPWLKHHNIDPSKFDYDVIPQQGAIGTVLHQGTHLSDDRYLFLIEVDGNHYLMEDEGLELLN